MRRILTIIMLLIVAGLVYYGLFIEEHKIKSFVSDKVENVNGSDFIKGATIDKFVRHHVMGKCMMDMDCLQNP